MQNTSYNEKRLPRWLSGCLPRVKGLGAGRRVLFTLKAQRELAALPLGLDEEDACDILASLEEGDCAGRQVSTATGEWMVLFKPRVGGAVLYIKLILRQSCVVLSFHEDEVGDETQR